MQPCKRRHVAPLTSFIAESALLNELNCFAHFKCGCNASIAMFNVRDAHLLLYCTPRNATQTRSSWERSCNDDNGLSGCFSTYPTTSQLLILPLLRFRVTIFQIYSALKTPGGAQLAINIRTRGCTALELAVTKKSVTTMTTMDDGALRQIMLGMQQDELHHLMEGSRPLSHQSIAT